MKKISDIFYIYTGSKLDLGKQQIDENGINFVSRNSNNNGVVGRVKLEPEMKVYKKGDISVSLGGSYLLSAFVQDENFVTAQNVDVLRPKYEMTEIEKWFYCYVLRENRFKFSAFGREVNKYIQDIEVPDVIPKWVYSMDIKFPKTNNLRSNTELDFSKWKEFKFIDIFNILKGFYNKKPYHNIEGDIPFLGAADKNNGVTEYYSIEDIDVSSKTGDKNNVSLDDKIFRAKAVCVTNNGSVGFAYYQPQKFTCSHDVNILYRKDGIEFNQYTRLFIATVIMKDRYRWTYGRKWRLERMVNSTLKLPATEDGNPDWRFMENYIKKLPYGDVI